MARIHLKVLCVRNIKQVLNVDNINKHSNDSTAAVGDSNEFMLGLQLSSKRYNEKYGANVICIDEQMFMIFYSLS